MAIPSAAGTLARGPGRRTAGGSDRPFAFPPPRLQVVRLSVSGPMRRRTSTRGRPGRQPESPGSAPSTAAIGAAQYRSDCAAISVAKPLCQSSTGGRTPRATTSDAQRSEAETQPLKPAPPQSLKERQPWLPERLPVQPTLSWRAPEWYWT